uniref:GUN4-like domain-containing protein n=1 Tax=Neogoniolithon spectabile TaxID=231755 RepID=A0A3G3MH54_9FLOR|nr:hypothetical protein [Neogoniolithon spectabile]AYR06153.1 hypothetical protein [Neogoniolithon spectabile]
MKDLLRQLDTIIKNQCYVSIDEIRTLIKRIQKSPHGTVNLMNSLINRKQTIRNNVSYTDGMIFVAVYNSKITSVQKTLKVHFSEGIVKLESAKNMNYLALYKALASQEFLRADIITKKCLSQLAGLNNCSSRQWLYFTDIYKLPETDLKTIDKLWRVYSYGKFGYSIQRKIWLSNNKDWDKFWQTIGWQINNKMIRYPDEFTWNQEALPGHLPLWNQLRGVQVISAFFNHSVWQ